MPPIKRAYLSLLAFLLIASAQAAVQFTVSPSTVPENYPGAITFQIDGVSPTESVTVQKFLDLNSNGVIDATDLLVQQFPLTNQQLGMVIAGVNNPNVPGDQNNSPDAITAAVQLNNGDFLQRVTGSHLFKLSSPAAAFAPIVRPLAVTPLTFPQGIQGAITAAGAPVPNAIAIFLLADDDGDGPGDPIGGVVTDALGRYSVRLPPGAYNILTMSAGTVCEFNPAAPTQLLANQTLTRDISVIPAPNSISGSLSNLQDPSQKIPGVFVVALSESGLLSISTSDANGDFRFGVTTGQWQPLGVEWGLILHGYIADDDHPAVPADSTGVDLRYPKANALFYGLVTDPDGQPMAGVTVDSENRDSSRWTKGLTDQFGFYAAAAYVAPEGFWDADVGDLPFPASYLFSESFLDSPIAAGEARRVDFYSIEAPYYVSGSLTDPNGAGIADIGIWANATINGHFYHVDSVRTDPAGRYSLPIAAGTWSIGGFLDLPDTYFYLEDRLITIVDRDATVDFLAIPRDAVRLTAPAIVGDQFHFQLTAAPHQRYEVQSSETLEPGDWFTIFTITPTQTATPIAIGLVGAEREFFRVIPMAAP